MTDSKLIDSSLWLEFLVNGNFFEIFDTQEIFYTSSLSLFEIKKKLLDKKASRSVLIKGMAYIKTKSIIVPVTDEIAEKAADYAIAHNLSAIDALLYSSTLVFNALFLSCDNDFRGLPHTRVFDKNKD